MDIFLAKMATGDTLAPLQVPVMAVCHPAPLILPFCLLLCKICPSRHLLYWQTPVRQNFNLDYYLAYMALEAEKFIFN